MTGRGPGLFLRGMAMGVAELVPGISGGTIAFVAGIYDELVRSLAAFSGNSAAMLRRDGWRAFARHHNLTFFLILGLGMASSFLLLANLVLLLLETEPRLVSGFFFGLIAASVLYVGRGCGIRWLASAGLAGLALGLAASLLLNPAAPQESPSLALVFLGGALAATAWILPGVSGAFILLLLGLYKPMLAALTSLDLPPVAALAAGLGLGILAFAKLLRWLLRHARAPLIALLTGVMAGSLPGLWPWPELAPLGSGAQLPGTLAAMAAGMIAIGGLAYASRRSPVG